jgi:predicted amidohydrolase
MRVALYQNNPVFGKIEENINTALDDIKGHTFGLLVLPELFATGYQFKDIKEGLALADRAGEGQTFISLKNLAQARDALIVYGFPEEENGHLYNSSMAVLPDGSFFCYRKTHLFDTEKSIFSPGNTGFFTIDFKESKIGMMICFDWRFPEAARKLALLGAQIICHPSNLVLPHCPDAMITRALENNLFTVTANRIGDENRTGNPLHFIGNSRIISPGGKILADLDENNTGFIACEINPAEADNKAIIGGNDIFSDRRPEYY